MKIPQFFPVLLSLFLTGCLTIVQTSTPAAPENHPAESESPQPSSEKVRLNNVLDAARRNLLEIRIIDSLQNLAGEYAENRLLLEIPSLAADPEQKDFFSSNDIRLRILDDAIAYNHLLSIGNKEKMVEERRQRSAELLDFDIAARVTELTAARELLELAEEQSEGNALRNRIEELELELRVDTGLSSEELARFDSSSLAAVCPIAVPAEHLHAWAAIHRSEAGHVPLPAGFITEFRRKGAFYRNGEFQIAEFLLRLPRRLALEELEGTSADIRGTAALANAAAVASQIDLDLTALQRAGEAWNLADLKLRLDSADRSAARRKIEALREWRIAWYRLLIDLGGLQMTEELPDFPAPIDCGPTPASETLFRLLEKVTRQHDHEDHLTFSWSRIRNKNYFFRDFTKRSIRSIASRISSTLEA